MNSIEATMESLRWTNIVAIGAAMASVVAITAFGLQYIFDPKLRKEIRKIKRKR
jgi:hypothetical protein